MRSTYVDNFMEMTMKKFVAVSLAALVLAGTANASFFGDNNKYDDPECWYNPDCNPYDPWDPRY